MTRTRPARALAGLVVGAAVALAAAAPASATVEITTPTSTSLHVKTTAGEPVAIDCLDGRVRVNDKPTPAGCPSLERVEVLGDALANHVDLSRLGTAFPSLAFRSVAGSPGADTVIGSPGADWLRGGAGDDRITGGDGDDRVDWYAGEGNDTFDGEAGKDAFTFFGGGGADDLRVVADGRRLRVETRSGTPVTADLGSTESLSVLGLGGDDTLRGPHGVTTLAGVFMDGNDGNDTLVGGDGADDVRGGPGDDDLAGADGDDVLLAGPGDDTLRWNVGHEQDVLRGDTGLDTVMALGGRGADAWSITRVSSQGARLAAEGDVPSGLKTELVERLHADAGPGDDGVTGSTGIGAVLQLVQLGGAGDDVLTGGDGDDEQTGGPGLDLLTGAGGNDTLHAGDGARDELRCDAGLDRASVDPVDDVSDCETVQGG